MNKDDWWAIYTNATEDGDTQKANNAIFQIIKMAVEDVYFTATRINNNWESLKKIREKVNGKTARVDGIVYGRANICLEKVNGNG